MRKFIILLAVSMLVGCGSDVSEIKESEPVTMTIKNLPITIEEKAQYYIHDELMPVYVMLNSYPSEALIDWNVSTGVHTEDPLEFVLVQNEAIRSLELYTKGLERIKVTINGHETEYAIESEYQIIEFKEAINSNKVTVQSLGEGRINECHITCDIEVDEETYQLYQALQKDLEALSNFTWSHDPIEAFATLSDVYNTFNVDKLDILSKNLDYYRLILKDGGEGCPYTISGKVIAVESKNNYTELTIDTLIEKEAITVYATDDYELNTMFNETCILIEKGQLLKFITIQ